jgi:hypothetical protein
VPNSQPKKQQSTLAFGGGKKKDNVKKDDEGQEEVKTEVKDDGQMPSASQSGVSEEVKGKSKSKTDSKSLFCTTGAQNQIDCQGFVPII